MSKYKYLDERDGMVFFTGKLMEIYIPKYFFDFNMAHFIGNKIKTIGAFQYIVYDNEDKRGDKDGKLYSIALPMDITFQYEEQFNSKDIKGKFEDNYNVFVLREGNIFIDHTIKEQSSENTKNFIFKLNGGKIPKTLLYDDVLKMFLESLLLNSVNLGNPSVIYETIIAELYRSKEDEKIPFRKYLNSHPSVTLYDYQAVNIKDLPNIKGTFQSLMFENIRQSVLYSVLKTKSNEEEIESPLEKVIKY